MIHNKQPGQICNCKLRNSIKGKYEKISVKWYQFYKSYQRKNNYVVWLLKECSEIVTTMFMLYSHDNGKLWKTLLININCSIASSWYVYNVVIRSTYIIKLISAQMKHNKIYFEKYILQRRSACIPPRRQTG